MTDVRHDPALHKQYPSAALRMFDEIAREWQLTEVDQLGLLGVSTMPAKNRADAAARGERVAPPDLIELRERITYVGSIDYAIRRPSGVGTAWLRRSLLVPPFDGCTPFVYMLRHGLAGMNAVRAYVLSLSNGCAFAWPPQVGMDPCQQKAPATRLTRKAGGSKRYTASAVTHARIATELHWQHEYTLCGMRIGAFGSGWLESAYGGNAVDCGDCLERARVLGIPIEPYVPDVDRQSLQDEFSPPPMSYAELYHSWAGEGVSYELYWAQKRPTNDFAFLIDIEIDGPSKSVRNAEWVCDIVFSHAPLPRRPLSQEAAWLGCELERMPNLAGYLRWEWTRDGRMRVRHVRPRLTAGYKFEDRELLIRACEQLARAVRVAGQFHPEFEAAQGTGRERDVVAALWEAIRAS